MKKYELPEGITRKRCQFCNQKEDIGKMIKTRKHYYCSSVCMDDYRALIDKFHPRHWEVLKYYQRFQGKSFPELW